MGGWGWGPMVREEVLMLENTNNCIFLHDQGEEPKKCKDVKSGKGEAKPSDGGQGTDQDAQLDGQSAL